MEPKGTIILSPEVVKLLQTVPAAEIEAVLKQAFPQFFDPESDKIDHDKAKKLLERMFAEPQPEPKSKIPVVEQIRRMRGYDPIDELE